MLTALGIQYFSPWRWVVVLGAAYRARSLMETGAELATRATPASMCYFDGKALIPIINPA